MKDLHIIHNPLHLNVLPPLRRETISKLLASAKTNIGTCKKKKESERYNKKQLASRNTRSSSFNPVFAALTILDYAMKKPYALNMQEAMRPMINLGCDDEMLEK